MHICICYIYSKTVALVKKSIENIIIGHVTTNNLVYHTSLYHEQNLRKIKNGRQQARNILHFFNSSQNRCPGEKIYREHYYRPCNDEQFGISHIMSMFYVYVYVSMSVCL